ncbi:hypothetical protein AV530_008843 [Patagioenas fasciata monilis]|uniref:B30.2/SPRY domain-containing protein n=1 Tax=Patagioenas fasciata monilis TaxID=372326 RepID=A0A1V4K4R8_PATFA|nr:hypothetical protein AV530_008843 [Patagioenas fasciata monilis]
MLCRSAGWFPQPEVLWRDPSGRHLPAASPRRSPDQSGLFAVEDAVVVTKNSNGSGAWSCTVRNSRFHQEQEASLHISAPFFDDARPFMASAGSPQSSAYLRPTGEGQVGGDSWWGLGVAKELVEKRDFGELSSDNGVWAVQHRNGQFVTLTSPQAPLALSPVPKSIWVFLDRAQGTVTFVDAGSGAEFCRFGPVSFGEEKIHPWFRVETAATRLCLRDGTPRPPGPGDNGDPKSAPDTSLEPLLGGKGAEITLSPLPDQTGALGASAV